MNWRSKLMAKKLLSFIQTHKDLIKCLLCAAFFSLPSLFNGYSNGLNLIQLASFLGSIGLIALIFLLFFRSPRSYFLLLSPIMAFNLVEIGHFFLFGVPSTQVTYRLLLETTFGEIWQFFKTYPLPVSQAFVFLGIPYLFICRLPRRFSIPLSIRLFSFISLSIIALVFFFSERTLQFTIRHVHPLSLGDKLHSLYQRNRQDSILLKQRVFHRYGAYTNNRKEDFTLVVVMGESVRRDHLQIYGYSRPTTPQLAKRDDLILFQDVISPATRTVPSIQVMFSLATPENLNLFYETSSVIGLAKEAKYYVTWISNQGNISPVDTGPTIISQEAHHLVSLNPLNLTSRYDMDMVHELEQALQQKYKQKLIVLHMLGSHFNYQDRYPPSFDFFKGTPPNLKGAQDSTDTWPVINSYDNSILYLDSFLQAVISKLENHNAALVYLSDHGESLFDDENRAVGHSLPITTPSQYEVPLIFWFSKQYALNNENKIEELGRNQHKMLSMNGFFHTFADLMEIQFDQFQAQASFFSPLLPEQEVRQVIDIRMNVQAIKSKKSK